LVNSSSRIYVKRDSFPKHIGFADDRWDFKPLLEEAIIDSEMENDRKLKEMGVPTLKPSWEDRYPND